MPLYTTLTPGDQVRRIGTQVEPNWLFGQLFYGVQPFVYAVTSVSLSGNVATLGVTIRKGGCAHPLFNLPFVGAPLAVQGTQSSSGVFNVGYTTKVSAVDFDNATGTGTISYALTGGDVAQTNDVGKLTVLPYPLADIVAAGDASIPAALIFSPDTSDNSRSLFASASWSGTIPTAATVVLQVANENEDSQFQTVANAQGTAPDGVVDSSDALATIADSAVTQSGALYSFLMGKFVRAKVLSMTGGDETTSLVVSLFA